jgi:hypothetical protein
VNWDHLCGADAMRAWIEFAKHRSNAWTIHVQDAGPASSYIGILRDAKTGWYECWYFAQLENGLASPNNDVPIYFKLMASDLDSLEHVVKQMRRYEKKHGRGPFT